MVVIVSEQPLLVEALMLEWTPFAVRNDARSIVVRPLQRSTPFDEAGDLFAKIVVGD